MIRPARAEDLPALIPIYDAARRFMAEHGNPTQWAASGYPNGEDLAEDIRLGQLYVLDEGGALHGAFQRAMDLPLFPLYHPASLIYNPRLAPQYQQDLERLAQWRIASNVKF